MRLHRRVIYQAVAWAPIVVAAAAITVGELQAAANNASYQAPVRLKRITAEEGSIFGAPPRAQANDAVGWHKPLDLPVRRKLVTAEEGSIFGSPPRAQANDAVGWHKPLDLPTRRKRSPLTEIGYAYFLPVEAETVTVDKWWRQLDLPVRRKIVTAEEGSIFGAPPKPEANDQLAWYRPLEAPTRAKRLPQSGIPGEARNAFPVVPWGWYAEIDKPVRLVKTPSNQISVTFVAAAPSNATTQNWFLPLEIPTRARKLYEFPATSIPVYFVPPTPGAGNEYNWFQPIGEPVRPRLSIRTAQQQGLTIAPRLLTTTLENAWHQRLDHPVRRQISVGRYTQGAESPYAATLVVVETITIDKWWQELARPTRLRVSIGRFLPGAQGNVNPLVPLVPTYLHAPHRLKGRVNYPALTAQGNINPIVPFAHTYLHAPHRLKGRIDRPAVAQGTVNPATFEVGKLNQWWRQLDLPVREWRKIAWQWFQAQPPTGVVFINPDSIVGGPADESERVACVPSASRTANMPVLLRVATVPSASRTINMPVLLRVATVPEQSRTVQSNDYRDRPCHDT